MTRRRWMADAVSGNRAFLLGAHAEHLARVLRARVGQEFEIVSPEAVRSGRIVSIDQDRVEFQLGEKIESGKPVRPTAAISIIKFARMEWAIEKCTELGIARIMPVIANRTDKHLASAAHKRIERWRHIAREASEQSRRSSPPEVCEPMKLTDAVSIPADTRIVLDESEHGRLLKQALQGATGSGDLLLAFGPEGGWTADESLLFRKSGWIAASLGHTILRAETAAIAAVSIAVSELQSPASNEIS
jgi:16S rRNA (uracil1498-N3)-methyltransferase